MGNKDLKTRSPIGSAINKELLGQLREYSKKTSTPMSQLLAKAIEQFLKSTNF